MITYYTKQDLDNAIGYEIERYKRNLETRLDGFINQQGIVVDFAQTIEDKLNAIVRYVMDIEEELEKLEIRQPILPLIDHADLEHEIWSSWMRYMFSQCWINPDGSCTLPAVLVNRWKRQMNTAYNDLPFDEKAGDIEQVEKHNTLLANGTIDRVGGTQGV